MRVSKILIIGRFFIFCVLLYVNTVSFSQPGQSENPQLRGLPRIIHYTKKDFNADPQFWTMAQGKNGILYFGNNDGVIIFDGERWQKVTLPNNSSVRSIYVSEQGAVYAGGFNEFGIVKQDEYGKYSYQSLLKLLRQEDRNFENVWQIHEVQGYIVFRSTKILVAITNNKAITLPASNVFAYSTVINDQLYIVDLEGVKKLELHSLEFADVVLDEIFKREEIVALLPGFKNEGLLLMARKGMVYGVSTENKKITFSRQLFPRNSNNLILCAIKSLKGTYYVGTLSTKVMVLHEADEQLTPRQAFQDIQDNTVLHLFESKEGNIWTLLNNGIDCIDVASPVSQLFGDAAIFDVLPLKRKLYLATNQGVFVSGENSQGNFLMSDFVKVDQLEGQAWSFHYFKETVLCSHDDGIFILEGRSIRKIPGITGVWKVIPVQGRPDDFLACTYEGIYLLHYDVLKGFVVQHRIEGFNESARDILQSDKPGIFWVCHGYKGVFRIKLNEKMDRVVGLEHFKDQHGLPSPYNINVFNWKGETVFTTNHGIFIFNETTNRFELYQLLTDLFGTDKNVRKLVQHNDRTWFVHDDEAGYFLTDSPNPALEKGLFLNLKGTFNESMECIVPVGANNVLIGTITGLYAFDLTQQVSGRALAKMLITKINIRHEEGEFYGPLETSSKSRLQLTHETGSLRFELAAPDFQDKTNIHYSYKLEGLDKGWSAWQENPAMELNYLRPGQYEFHVRARSLLGERSTESIYYFEIFPAWYQSVWAYILYGVTAVLLIIIGFGMVKRKIHLEKQKTRDEEEKKRKVLELELQQIKLKQEKEQITKDKEQLEEDVIYKSKELANYTMLLVKKRELLAEMSNDLKTLKESIRHDATRQVIVDLMKKISANLQNEEHLQVFEANFEKIHHEFFAQLKSAFSDLSQKELQLCAFVRMNLTNKEIASILNISVRGVETARYRLRKRLGMSHEQDMAEFLEKLYSSSDRSPGDMPEEVG